MGTRHLIAVVSNGEYKVAQYGQWDGYLSGQGKTVFEFISQNDMTQFKTKVDGCSFMSESEGQALFDKCEADGKDWSVVHPELSRDTGAKILQLILEKGPMPLCNNIQFAADSLFCEYAYVLDLDNQMLEIYTGFNKGKVPKGERFADLKPQHDDYGPIALAYTIPFSEVNSETFAELVKFHSQDEAV